MAKGPAKKAASKKPARAVAKNSAKAPAKAKPLVPPAKKAMPSSVPAPRAAVTPPPIPAVKAPAGDAVKIFERGMAALHGHDYKAASATFESLIAQFPSEGFLTDRARVYLGLAARELARRPAGSGNVEERLTAATLALNNHQDGEAARLAGDVQKEDRTQDLAAYLLAVVASRRGEVDTALTHLRDAIAINPECRLQARQDEEFDPLMDSDDFHALIEAPAGADAQLRKPVRKPGR
jgi:tetratricopeptide (TPR) repeat protein